jgi:hypothetical protein
MLREWGGSSGRVDSIFVLGRSSLASARPDAEISPPCATFRPEPDGDIAFDVDPMLEAATDVLATMSTPDGVIPMTRG